MPPVKWSREARSLPGGKWIMARLWRSGAWLVQGGFVTKLEVIETPAGHMFCPRHEVTGVRIPMRLNDVRFRQGRLRPLARRGHGPENRQALQGERRLVRLSAMHMRCRDH